MSKRIDKSIFLSHILIFTIVTIIFCSSLGFTREHPKVTNITSYNIMEMSVGNGEYEEVNLPCELKNIEPETPIRLRTTIYPKDSEGLYIKTIYSEADVYFNNEHVFTFGKKENYPQYMRSPAIEVHIIETEGYTRPIDVLIEYKFPSHLPQLYIEPPELGTSKEVMLKYSNIYGVPLILALTQIVSGIILMVISVCIIFINNKGYLFSWLGLFSLASGFSFYGLNDFSKIMSPYSAFLYISSYMGMAIVTSILVRFVRLTIDFENTRPLIITEIISLVAEFIPIALQSFGLVQIHRFKTYLKLVMIIAIFVLILLNINEYVKYKNKASKRILLPLLVLFVSVIGDVFLNRMNVENVIMLPTQIGSLSFMIIMGITAGMTVKDTVEIQRIEKKLAYEKKMLDIQTAEQRESRLLLVEKEKLLSQQRHDLRHHLAVIKELVDEDNIELREYLDVVTDKIPKARMAYCENNVVNAIVSHFAGICEENKIKFDCHLSVPNTNSQLTDSNLCVIFANLLENAIEACMRMESGNRFINIKSSIRHSILTITMDNSFDGQIMKSDDHYYSSKRDEFGIGISSIRSIVDKYRGGAEFRNDENTFYSSIYLLIE